MASLTVGKTPSEDHEQTELDEEGETDDITPCEDSIRLLLSASLKTQSIPNSGIQWCVESTLAILRSNETLIKGTIMLIVYSRNSGVTRLALKFNKRLREIIEKRDRSKLLLLLQEDKEVFEEFYNNHSLSLSDTKVIRNLLAREFTAVTQVYLYIESYPGTVVLDAENPNPLERILEVEEILAMHRDHFHGDLPYVQFEDVPDTVTIYTKDTESLLGYRSRDLDFMIFLRGPQWHLR